MLDNWRSVLTFFSALGCGIAGGVFFAFSTFVMRALARLPAPRGIAAMQSINVAAITPAFMTVLFGTAAGCLVLAFNSLFAWQDLGAAWLLVGTLLYLVGTIGVTIVFNVPRNNALAGVDPDAPDSGGVWQRYLTTWTAWNHVRTAAALAAAACLIVALCWSRHA